MADDTMKAVLLQDYGGPEALEFEEVPRPQPAEGQVQIRVHAAGVNPADWKFGAGYFKEYVPLEMPWTPGFEGAGVVSAVGSGVTQFQEGQPVFGILSGSYAEYALADAEAIQPKPDNVTFEEAASIPMGALTAWSAVVDAAQVQPGQRVLIHGGAGGVGLYAVQLVRWFGAHAIATASTSNVDFVRSLGADQVIDYTAVQFETVVHDLDVVIDTVAGDLVERSLTVLRPGGIYVTMAAMVGPDLGKEQGVRAVAANRAPEPTLAEITRLVEAGHLKPLVGEVFRLNEARQAQKLSQTGHGRGRIILQMME